MSIDTSNFDQMSIEIAKDFLRSVVVVDDRLVVDIEEPVTKLEPPGRQLRLRLMIELRRHPLRMLRQWWTHTRSR